MTDETQTPATPTPAPQLPPAVGKALDFISKFFPKVDGYKTYIIGGIAIVYGIITHDGEMIVYGLGLMTLRSGLKKETTKAAEAASAKTGAALVAAAKAKEPTREEMLVEPQPESPAA